MFYEQLGDKTNSLSEQYYRYSVTIRIDLIQTTPNSSCRYEYCRYLLARLIFELVTNIRLV
jgi:hypothetical protein